MAPDAVDQAAKKFSPPPGQANLYVYRNETFGSAVKMSVDLDGMSLGDTGPHTYLYTPISSGSHNIVSKAGNDTAVTIDAKPGTNYFLWQEVKMGWVSAGSDLQVVDETTGKAGVNDCKLALTNPSRSSAGCSKDTDCKGDRVCKAGACVEATPAPLTN